MEVQETNEFADFVEKNTFQSPVRDALLKDIRAGVYSNGTLPLPKVSLLAALKQINASNRVIDRANSLNIDQAETIDHAALIAEATAMLSQRKHEPFVLPSISDQLLEQANEKVAEMLFPNSQFMDALANEADVATKRTIASHTSKSIG